VLVKSNYKIAPTLGFALLGSVLVGCSTEQITRTAHNVARGELCMETDDKSGLEPCGGDYARYKVARENELRQNRSEVISYSQSEINAANNDKPDSSDEHHAGSAMAPPEGINGCWVHHTQQSKGRSNKLTLCTYDVTARLTVEFPNALTEYAPTSCTQSGAANHLINHAVVIALNSGKCKNGNTSPPLYFECKLNQEKLECDDRKYGKHMVFARRPEH